MVLGLFGLILYRIFDLSEHIRNAEADAIEPLVIIGMINCRPSGFVYRFKKNIISNVPSDAGPKITGKIAFVYFSDSLSVRFNAEIHKAETAGNYRGKTALKYVIIKVYVPYNIVHIFSSDFINVGYYYVRISRAEQQVCIHVPVVGKIVPVPNAVNSCAVEIQPYRQRILR